MKLKLLTLFCLLAATCVLAGQAHGKTYDDLEKTRARLRSAIAKKYSARNANVVADVIRALEKEALASRITTIGDLKKLFGYSPFTVGPRRIGVPLQKGLNNNPSMGPSQIWYLVCVIDEKSVVTHMFLQFTVIGGLLGHDQRHTADILEHEERGYYLR